MLPAVTKFFESSNIHNQENIIAKENFSKTQKGITKGKSTFDNIRKANKAAMTLKIK